MTREHSRARRRLLQHSLGATLLGSGMASMNGKLDLMGSALAATGDYTSLGDFKALVCVFLYGGSDSNNLFVPLDQSLYDDYESARDGLAIPKDELLASNDGIVGFNPNLQRLRDYYDEGQLAIMGNVGNLIRPVTRNQYMNGSSAIPADLFAHNHQQEQVMKSISSRPSSLVGAGWGGRMADLLRSANNTTLPPTLSMDGSNLWQPGLSSTPVAVNPQSGPRLISFLDTNNQVSTQRRATFERIMGLPADGPLQRFAGNALQRARGSSTQLLSALNSSPNFDTPYNSSSRLAVQLRMVTRLIAGRQTLGMQRQIFFVGMGGWDTHDNQTARLNLLTRDLNDGLYGFQSSLEELGVTEQVTTFTASDFGRTLTINGDGSDHGWSGHSIVMGGAVKGRQLVGGWPDYRLGGPEDVSDKGRLIPRVSTNQFGAALGSWMDVTDSDLLEIFPDLANFDQEWQQRYGLFI